MYTSLDVQQNTGEDLPLVPCFLKAGHFVFYKVLFLQYKQLSARHCVLMPLGPTALKSAHAASFRSCCRCVRFSSIPMEVPASFPLALNTVCLSAVFSKCTSTLSSTASFLGCKCLTLTPTTAVAILSDSRPFSATLRFLVSPLLRTRSFFNMAFSSFLRASLSARSYC